MSKPRYAIIEMSPIAENVMTSTEADKIPQAAYAVSEKYNSWLSYDVPGCMLSDMKGLSYQIYEDLSDAEAEFGAMKAEPPCEIIKFFDDEGRFRVTARIAGLFEVVSEGESYSCRKCLSTLTSVD